MTDPASHAFSVVDRDAVYRAILTRRDVRGQFRPDVLPPTVLARILTAAHHAPSVGFMQPWDFVVIEDIAIRRAVKASFDKANARAAENYTGDRRQIYSTLKLEGILDSPVNICVTCDRSRGGPHVLGRNTVLEADLFSTCLAVENLWLAARAEGVGVGWVSILNPTDLAPLLGLPPHVVSVAYLCVGYVTEIHSDPDLRVAGWRDRLPLDGLIHRDRWGSPHADLTAALPDIESPTLPPSDQPPC